MRGYLVRLKKNQELVGIFVGNGIGQLLDHIDECCDPYECEFLLLPAGGFYLPKAGAPKIPTIIADPEDEKSYPDWFSGAVLSEYWIDVFHREEEPCWMEIEDHLDI